jgi:hypothetical protein
VDKKKGWKERKRGNNEGTRLRERDMENGKKRERAHGKRKREKKTRKGERQQNEEGREKANKTNAHACTRRDSPPPFNTTNMHTEHRVEGCRYHVHLCLCRHLHNYCPPPPPYILSLHSTHTFCSCAVWPRLVSLLCSLLPSSFVPYPVSPRPPFLISFLLSFSPSLL